MNENEKFWKTFDELRDNLVECAKEEEKLLCGCGNISEWRKACRATFKAETALNDFIKSFRPSF